MNSSTCFSSTRTQINRDLFRCAPSIFARKINTSRRIYSSQKPIEDLSELKLKLEEAIKIEDYDLATVLRDQIKDVESQDPLVSLQNQLTKAIAEERYEEAAALRDQVKELLPPPRTPATIASKTTEGVKVSVQSVYVPSQSRPDADSYFFAYKITITNVAHPSPIKLVAREWLIIDENDHEQRVQGPGVVGEQPILKQGQSFSYDSACPLQTAHGTMQGKYEFHARQSSDTGNWCTSFLVEIPLFELSVDGPTTF